MRKAKYYTPPLHYVILFRADTMALNAKDKSKLLHSIARWLAGLGPLFGRRHYFEKYTNAECIASKLSKYRGCGTCPFCGKKFRRLSALVAHIMKYHGDDVESLIESCRESS